MRSDHSQRQTVPDLSAILITTDYFEPICKTVRALAAQTVRDRLELVIVCPSEALLGLVETEVSEFHSVRVIEMGQIKTTSAARVAGIREASASVVALCEDHEAWAVAVPSIWEEPFGHVAIEAMMNGVAVVASSSGGLGGIVCDGQTGFLVPPGDAAALAAALLQLLDDRGLAERLGRAAYELAMAQFSEAKMVDQFVELCRSICRNSV
jgi:glycosyltransferase involved in cell wall biosynthesis